jgi:hypothetical protein
VRLVTVLLSLVVLWLVVLWLVVLWLVVLSCVSGVRAPGFAGRVLRSVHCADTHRKRRA